jgi:glutamate mutase epsilon subunit
MENHFNVIFFNKLLTRLQCMWHGVTLKWLSIVIVRVIQSQRIDKSIVNTVQYQSRNNWKKSLAGFPSINYDKSQCLNIVKRANFCICEKLTAK